MLKLFELKLFELQIPEEAMPALVKALKATIQSEAATPEPDEDAVDYMQQLLYQLEKKVANTLASELLVFTDALAIRATKLGFPGAQPAARCEDK
jgi:hypothetical protein